MIFDKVSDSLNNPIVTSVVAIIHLRCTLSVKDNTEKKARLPSPFTNRKFLQSNNLKICQPFLEQTRKTIQPTWRKLELQKKSK